MSPRHPNKPGQEMSSPRSELTLCRTFLLTHWFASVFLFGSLLLPLVSPLPARAEEATHKSEAPVNPHASPEARALLRFFYSISGKHTLTGQHNTPSQIDRWSNRAFELTGKYPGLYGQDFGFSAGSDKDSVLAREAMIEEVKEQHRNGAVITLSWHAVRPTDDEPCSFRDSVQGHLSDFEWQELVTPGTRLHTRWCLQVDEIAGYLKLLCDAHIPVLFRPYHEINGNWFWWNGRPGPNGSAALYRQLYDRYVNYHHLDNLLWVWNTGGPSQNEPLGPNYYPGHDYVDLLSIDIYGQFHQTSYEYMVSLAAGKPVALGEVGAVPSIDVLSQQPKWVYFLIWSEFVDFYNPLGPLLPVFNDPRQLNRGDTGLAVPMEKLRHAAAPTTSIEPVTPKASENAKSLLARLYATSGHATFSGQQYKNSDLPDGVEKAFQTLGKRPALFAADLAVIRTEGVTLKERRNAIINEAKRQAKAGAVISLTWRAPSPIDDEPAVTDKISQQPLSDFEWNELLTPGTRLHQRWLTQVNEVAASLKSLQEADVPVLWRPYPEANLTTNWWGGRKGVHGAGALYRQLFDRLAVHHRLTNLIWVWTGAPAHNSEVPGTAFHDYFPGLLYVDALAISLNDANSASRGRMPNDRILLRAGLGKPVGIEASPTLLTAESLSRQPNYAWFLLSSLEMPEAEDKKAELLSSLRALYASPQVISLESTPK
jgi:mannan endo-1,4-beta-mannosidase